MIMGKMIRAAFAVVICATPGLTACTQSSLRISSDFGNAVHQDTAAQIADPDAHYQGTPAPGSNGARVSLAQRRYQANQVIPPSSVTASGAGSIGRADNGTGGGSGMGASAGVSQ
jgi:hypothetical protein